MTCVAAVEVKTSVLAPRETLRLTGPPMRLLGEAQGVGEEGAQAAEKVIWSACARPAANNDSTTGRKNFLITPPGKRDRGQREECNSNARQHKLRERKYKREVAAKKKVARERPRNCAPAARRACRNEMPNVGSGVPREISVDGTRAVRNAMKYKKYLTSRRVHGREKKFRRQKRRHVAKNQTPSTRIMSV